MTKLERLEKRIALAVARAKALGYGLIVRQRYGVDYKDGIGWYPDGVCLSPGVCICGAIALAENPKDGRGIIHAIARKYGITEDQAMSLSDGFEGNRYGWDRQANKLDKVWYRIGRKWARRAEVEGGL